MRASLTTIDEQGDSILGLRDEGDFRSPARRCGILTLREVFYTLNRGPKSPVIKEDVKHRAHSDCWFDPGSTKIRDPAK